MGFGGGGAGTATSVVADAGDSVNGVGGGTGGDANIREARPGEIIDPVTGKPVDVSKAVDPATGKPLTKTRRVKLLIGGGITVAALLVVAIVGVLVFMPRGEKGGKKTTAVSTDGAFAQYANYLLFDDGDEATALENVSIANQYKINAMLFENSEDSKAYFKNLKTYFDKFTESYNASGLAEKSYYLSGYIPYYEQLFNFIYDYSQAGKLDRNSLASIYADGNASGLDAYFEDNYAVFNGTGLDVVQDFYNYESEVLNYQKQYFTVAQQNDCIMNHNLIGDCSVSLSTELTSTYANAASRATNIIRLSVDQLIGSIPKIVTELASPVGDEPTVDVIVNDNGVSPDEIHIEINALESETIDVDTNSDAEDSTQNNIENAADVGPTESITDSNANDISNATVNSENVDSNNGGGGSDAQE